MIAQAQRGQAYITMAEGETGKSPLFEDVVYSIVDSEEMPPDQTRIIIQIVQHNGGRYIPFEDIDRDDNLDEITHIISATIDFPQYLKALDRGVAIVKPTWVTHSVNKMKLCGTRQYTPDPSQFFQDVVVTTSGLPDGDKDAILAGVMALGGLYSNPLSKAVTHLVALNEDGPKVKMAHEKNLSCKILLPHWFDDCLKLGRKINERPYLLPNPEYLSRREAKIRDIPSDHMEGATTARPDGPPSSSAPESSPTDLRKGLNCIAGKRVLLSDDLDLSEHLEETLVGMIEYAGATMTNDVERATVYVGHYREGEQYVRASRRKIVVGNLSWLYHVLNRNEWSNPMSKLLHYPIPRNGIPGFQDFVISLSNYNGDARTYLENLAACCGAQFTKTMKQTNTHLITAHTKSEKCDAAQEWNINVVNHIWLEESYANCEAQSLTNPRYTHFPARTNLGEVVGQTPFNTEKLERLFYPEPRKTPSKSAQSTPAKKTKAPPIKAASKARISEVMADEEPTPDPSTAKRPRGRPPKSATTPRVQDLIDDEKENESPVPRGSERASKVKARGALHENANDIAEFQKEMKRKGGVTHGGRRSSIAEEFSSPAPATDDDKPRRKKRTSEEATYDITKEGSDLSDGETQVAQKPAKKVKTKSNASTAELPPIQYKMMVTGDDRWVDKPRVESQDRTTLRQMGVQLTQETNKEIDILVAPKLLRTRKFVCALAAAPMVVDTTYLDHALKQKELPESPRLLQDSEGEARFGFKLSEALERAKINDRRLFRGWHIFVTKDVSPSFDTYKEIISLNGGAAYLFSGRNGSVAKGRLRNDPDAGEEAQHQGGDEEFEYVYLVSGGSGAEKRLWKSFHEMVDRAGLKPRIVKNDWLLGAAMAQRVEWREEWDLEGEHAE